MRSPGHLLTQRLERFFCSGRSMSVADPRNTRTRVHGNVAMVFLYGSIQCALRVHSLDKANVCEIEWSVHGIGASPPAS